MTEIKNRTEFIKEIEKQIMRDTKWLIGFIFLNILNMLVFFLTECYNENLTVINVIWGASALLLSFVIAIYFVDLFEKNENLKTLMKTEIPYIMED